MDDVCDYHFECLTRCCNKSTAICAHFFQCVQSCKRNSECNSECCSFGYCSSENLCFSRKIDGDYCDKASECESALCTKNKCSKQEPVLNSQAIIGLSLISGLVFITVTLYCCLCRFRLSRTSLRRKKYVSFSDDKEEGSSGLLSRNEQNSNTI